MSSHIYPNLGFGLGLRTPHYDYVLKKHHTIDWLEIISENYLDAHAGYWDYLTDVRAHTPLVMHGVSLSIGGTDAFNNDYLSKLKHLAHVIQPAWVSDHLCFTGMGGHNTHDLLPIPYTQQSLRHVIERIDHVQNFLGRPLILENPSTYLEFQQSDIPEWEFIHSMAQASGCGILLDINNVYVNCFNHGYNPTTYLEAIPANHIAQIHLAGHANQGSHIIDTHDRPVIDEVWTLYAQTIQRIGPRSTMIEWDENIPDFPVLLAELNKARTLVTPP